jgi:hypothetical protein
VLNGTGCRRAIADGHRKARWVIVRTWIRRLIGPARPAGYLTERYASAYAARSLDRSYVWPLATVVLG